MDLKKLIDEYLKEAKLMQLATAKDNQPWVASVWYAHDDNFTLYFISKHHRRHSGELKDNSKVAGAIVVPHEDLGVKVKGIQFEGEASEVSLVELPKAFELYLKRFPKATDYLKSIQDIIADMTDHRLYKIKPSKIVLFDEVNFPDDPRQELDLS